MNQRRHFNPIIPIAVTLAITTMASAAGKERPPAWNNGSPPVFHTNQDGPWESQAPVTPIDILIDNEAPGQADKPTLIDLVADVGFTTPIEHEPEQWSPTGPLPTDAGMTVSAPSMPKGMNPVPGPATLMVLAMAGLAGRRRRG